MSHLMAKSTFSSDIAVFLKGAALFLAILLFWSCSDMGRRVIDNDTGLPDQTARFGRDVVPIFQAHCANCHINRQQGGLSLASYQSLMAGGNSGPVVVPFRPDSSLLIMKIEGTIQPQMPLGGDPLPAIQIEKLRRWIADGALDN